MASATIATASHSHGGAFGSPAMAPIVSEADVILPPPTACNPIPSLPAALRLDNREQLLQVLQESSSLRQLLVFEDDALRTLLLRQVLNDPKTNANNNNNSSSNTAGNKQTKKNWDTYNVFHYPKSLQPSIVGTRLLHKSLPRTAISASSSNTGGSTILSMTAGGGGTEVSIHPQHKDNDADLLGETTLAAGQHVDIVLYFVRPCQLATTQTLVTRIPRWKHVKHRLFYLPQPSALVQQLLVDSGLAANPSVEISSLQLDLFPLESDVISMEYPTALQEATLEGTPSTLVTTCARTILKLQDVIGIIPRIQALGPLGEDVLTKSLHMAVEEYLQRTDSQPERPRTNTKVAMIILDRQVDMITPLVTPLTYEGLLDEVVGIENGFLQLSLQTLNPEEETNPSTVVALGVHAGDTLYAEVRDQHVEKFGSFLQNQAKALQESHANFTNKGTKKDLNEIHQFVKQIPMFTQNLRSLTNHIHLAELIKAHTEQVTFREQWQTERSIIEGESCYDMLEEWICSNHPISKVLRGLCLLSLCSGGVRSNRYDHLRALIVQGYGYEYLLKLHDLERLGWIRRKDTLWMDSTSSAFANLRKSLILIHAEVDTVEPDDVAYVTSGYAPLSVRLIQAAIQGWTKTRAELLKEIPGRLVDIQQSWPPVEFGKQSIPRESLGDFAKETTTSTPHNGAATATTTSIKPTLMVFFVGGISYAEIAALRFLSKRPTFPFHIIMMTTKIVNGNTMLQQTME